MLKFDLVKYVGKFALWNGAVVLYDALIEKTGSELAIRDGLTFGVSSVWADIVSEVIYNIASIQKNSIPGLLTSPLFSGILYMYLYNMMVKNNYPNYSHRWDTNNFIYGWITNLLLSWVENPLLNLWGIKSY